MGKYITKAKRCKIFTYKKYSLMAIILNNIIIDIDIDMDMDKGKDRIPPFDHSLRAHSSICTYILDRDN